MKIYHLLKLKLFFLIPLLCSCGQMGPLYLPETAPPEQIKKDQQTQPVDEKTKSGKSLSPQNQ